MDSTTPVKRATADRAIASGWAAMLFAVVGYVLVRYGFEGPFPLAVAQVFYLTPVFAAAAALALAACCSVPNVRSRRVWALLAAAMSAVFISEAILSAQVIFALDSDVTSTVFDAANLAAALLFGWMLVYAARVDRLGWRSALHVLLDVVALLALGFALLYGYYSGGGTWSTRDALAAARFSSYGVLAAAVMVGDVAAFGTPSAMRFKWNRPLASGILLLALAIGGWSAVGMVVWPNSMPSSVDAAVGVAYLVSYCLVFMAALYRMRTREPASLKARTLRIPAVWPSAVVSTLVLLSVFWTGLLAIMAPRGSVSAAVYMTTLAVATVTMVLRTALLSAETDELAQRVLRDPTTGAFAPAMTEGCFAAVEGLASRHGGVTAAFSIDLDDFAQVNAAVGYRAGDRQLAAVAEALRRTAGGEARVLRVRSDEFLVFMVVRDRVSATTTGREMLAAIRRVEPPGRPLTASIGIALMVQDAHDVESLVRFATLAQVWVKRHGKGRVSVYDSHVASALALDERLSNTDDRARLDMVRSLLAAVDARDPANRYHARNVAALARLFAQDLGFEAEHVSRIEVAAILHDVGKIALPNRILGGKALPFSVRHEEQEHSGLGEQLAESLGVPGVPQWVRSHHERWDGEGYPDRLSASAIPIESRLIALCDAYDGMISGKRYGAPMSKAAALQEIDLGIGTRFDPDLAERFISVVGKTGALGWSDDWAGQ